MEWHYNLASMHPNESTSRLCQTAVTFRHVPDVTSMPTFEN